MPSSREIALDLTSSNCTSDGAGGWLYTPPEALRLSGTPSVSLQKLVFCQSIFNVTSANNVFQILDNSTSTTTPHVINCALPTGIYDSVALGNAVIAFCTTAGFYTLFNGAEVTYLSLAFSQTSQRYLITSNPVPTSYSGTSTAGSYNPNSLGTTGYGPSLVVSAGFGQLIGRAARHLRTAAERYSSRLDLPAVRQRGAVEPRPHDRRLP